MWGIAHILQIYEWEYFDVFEERKEMLDRFDMVTTEDQRLRLFEKNKTKFIIAVHLFICITWKLVPSWKK